MKVLYVGVDKDYIIKIGNDDYLLVHLDRSGAYSYAWSPNVFLRFMPYAVPFKGDEKQVIEEVQKLIDSGVLPHSERDILKTPNVG